MSELRALDERVLTMADRIEASGKVDDAEALRAAFAYVRETWRGSQVGGNLAEDLQQLAENAAQAEAIVTRHLDLL